MSHLQRKWAKSRLNDAVAMHAMAPPPGLPEFNELDEDRYGSASVPNTPQDDDSSSASSVSSTGTVIPSPGRALFARPQGFPGGHSLDPIPWTTYFERELFLPSEDGAITYHAYLTSPAPPSAPGKAGGPLFVTHHGAGSSGLSFAVLSAEIRKRLPTAGILSLDARGHGLTSTSATTSAGTTASSSPTTAAHHHPREEAGAGAEPDSTPDLTLPTLAADLRAVLSLTQSAMRWPSLPPIILVGHSLGGAVVTEFASSSSFTTTTAASPSSGINSSSSSSSSSSSTTSSIDLLGYAVLDVVEGSAMDALQSMHTYLAGRPGGFGSLRDAVEWHVRSRTLRNAVSARASVPGLLVRSSPSSSSLDDTSPAAAAAAAAATQDAAAAGDGGGGGRGRSRTKNNATEVPWRWRTDLASTQPFWEGWFVGLSKKFLRGRGGKLLLLAGTDRLDTELTIGQMQGKYALQVFPEAGHFIHEDLPEKTAIALVDFYRRNDRSALVLPPKVSELLAQGKKV